MEDEDMESGLEEESGEQEQSSMSSIIDDMADRDADGHINLKDYKQFMSDSDQDVAEEQDDEEMEEEGEIEMSEGS